MLGKHDTRDHHIAQFNETARPTAICHQIICLLSRCQIEGSNPMA